MRGTFWDHVSLPQRLASCGAERGPELTLGALSMKKPFEEVNISFQRKIRLHFDRCSNGVRSVPGRGGGKIQL